MQAVIWKSFKLGDIFTRSTKLAISVNQKDLSVVEEYDDNHCIALISASRKGSGKVGYIENNIVTSDKVSINKITFDDQWGFTFFQRENFVITGGHNAILEINNPRLKNKLDSNLICYTFLSLLINKITFKSGLFGYGYKINNKFDREIILLPCLEVGKNDDYIWEQDNHYYTLAIEYIYCLMDKAKNIVEQKTINLYQSELDKLIKEQQIYKTGYSIQKKSIKWKKFYLGDFLNMSSKHVIKNQIKNLHLSKSYIDGYVANVTASKENKGVVGYIAETDEIKTKKINNILTLAPDAAYAGVCFYHKEYIISTGHNKILTFTDEKLKSLFDANFNLYEFLASIITKIFCKTFFGFSKSITENDFDKQIILLPCLEVGKNDDYIWEKDGEHLTLADNFISYIYLEGKINFYKYKIKNYKNQF